MVTTYFAVSKLRFLNILSFDFNQRFKKHNLLLLNISPVNHQKHRRKCGLTQILKYLLDVTAGGEKEQKMV
jgi:hypothetical protein